MPANTKLTTTNACNLLLRTFIGIPGMAKTALEVYQDGELLCLILPEPEVKWIKSEEEQAALDPVARKAYEEADKAWAESTLEITLTAKQHERVKAILNEAPKLTPMRQSRWLFQLYKDCGVVPDWVTA